jgi:hypothetical protein
LDSDHEDICEPPLVHRLFYPDDDLLEDHPSCRVTDTRNREVAKAPSASSCDMPTIRPGGFRSVGTDYRQISRDFISYVDPKRRGIFRYRGAGRTDCSAGFEREQPAYYTREANRKNTDPGLGNVSNTKAPILPYLN